MLALSLGIPRLQADTATSTLTLESGKCFTTTNTSRAADDGVTWKVTTTKGSIQGWQSNSPWYADQFGSKNTAWAGYFSTSDIKGTITKIEVECGTGGSANVAVSVGAKSFDTTKAATASSVSKITFSGNGTLNGSESSGIVVTVSGTSKAFYLRSIAVTYETGPSAPTFEIGGVAVTGSYEAVYGSKVEVTVKCPGVDELQFLSPESTNITADNHVYTIASLTEVKTITVKGVKDGNEYGPSTLVVSPIAPEAPIFRVNGKDVSGTLTLDIGKSETVNVACDGATSLVFTSPEELTVSKDANAVYTIPSAWIVSPNPTTITVAGSNDVGRSEASTLNVEFKAPVVTVDAPIFKLADGTTLSGSATVEAGTEITVGSATADATVTLSAEPAGSVVINGVTATVNKTSKLTAVATRTVNDVVGTATSTLDVTVKENTPTGTVYKLINSTDDLVDGMTFVIASNTKNVLMGSKTESHTYLDPVNFTFPSTGNEIEVEDEKVNILTLVSTGTADKWKIKTSDGNYLYWTSGNSLNVGTTPSGNTYVATISFSGDNAKIAFNNQTSQYIQYNSGSPRFACYSSNQSKVQIYAITTPRVAAPTFIVADGATFETGSDGIVYYTNPATVTIASATPGAAIHYTITVGDTTETVDVESNSVTLENLKELTSITAYATCTDYEDSKEESAKYHFRTATPVITCDDPTEAQRKTVTISCATNDATIEYSIDGGTTWKAYPADGIVFDESGKTVNIKARAKSELSEGYTDVVEYHVAIYPELKWQPFELVTDITKIVPGDEVIFVASDYNIALAPYEGNDDNCKSTEITKTGEAGETVNIDPSAANVGIYTIEKTDDGKYRFKGTFTAGYLAAVAGDVNKLHCHVEMPPEPVHADEATIVIDPTTGHATITFVGEGVTHNVMRYLTGGKLFSCYEPDNASSTLKPVSIYRRGEAATYAPRPTATPMEGVYEAGEITEVTLQCLDADGNAVTDPSLKIFYTTDGSNPRKGGMLYTAPIPVGDNLTVRAYATMDGYFDSPSLIASYDIFTPGKEYRRVTAAEMRHLSPDDDIIVLGSPSDEESVYALSRNQVSEGNYAYREAVKLDNVVKSDGRIVINKKDVQVLTLLEGDDYYGGYDWRLYASGSSIGIDGNTDGFLLAEGNVNALKTIRIDTPADDRLPNADVRFHSIAESDYGNEYGGVTVQFGSPDGHELDFPKLMALTRTGADSYRFDVRKEADFTAATPSSWYVSIFKVFDPTMLYAPSFTNLDSRVTPETKIEITSPNTENNPETEIWYSMDGGATWTKYTEPFTIPTMGTYHVLARTRNANLTGGDENGYSDIVTQTYIVTDNEIFELVTDASTLKENDRIVFVNAVKYKKSSTDEASGWYTPADFDSANGRFNATEVKPVDATETIPQSIVIPSESTIQVFRLEYDTSAKDPQRPWVLFANGHENPVYLRSAKAKEFELSTLPEDIDSRQYYNVKIDIKTNSDYVNYASATVTGTVADNAYITFNGSNNVRNYMRFNPSGGLRFRGYEEKSGAEEGVVNTSTWPVRVYRAAKRVLPPTVTVYDATAEGDKAYETEIETFSNAVRVVIKHNPNTDKGADLLYSWSQTKENAPVLSEYLEAEPKDAAEIQLRVDGNSIEIFRNGSFGNIDGLASIEGNHVLRAVTTDGINTSASLPRIINFKCSKPVVSKGTGNAVQVTRPGGYTIGARLYYSYDDEPIVEDEAHRLNYASGSTMFEQIPFDGHSKVNVQAVKDGYEPSDIAVYTPYTYVPRAHAVQLLELTDEGKAEYAKLLGSDAEGFIDETPCYVTNRTVETGQFYIIKESGDELLMTPCTDNVKARELKDYRPANTSAAKVNVKWTTDYYVHVVDEDALLSAIGGAEKLGNGDNVVDDGEIVAKIFVNGSADGIGTKRSTFMLNGVPKVYHGALLKRHGAIGTIMLNSTVEYTVKAETGDENYAESGSDQITPLIPSVYGGSYAYTYSQEPQDLTRDYPTDFLKFKVESRVKKNDDGTPSESEVLIPTSEVDPRHLDVAITFFRPNVSDEILMRNDIYYTVQITGRDSDVEGSGLYVDRVQDNMADGALTVLPEYYQFTVKDVSPREDIYPTLEVVATEYVENYTGSDNYGRFISNYGDNLVVEAANSPMLGQGTISKIHLGHLAPGGSDLRGNTNSSGKYSWMYKGHNDLVPPEELVHDNNDNTEDAIRLAPVYYHVETYSSGMTDYASYEYLVKHVDGHNESDSPALKFAADGSFITDDEVDPLLGTYIANGFAAYTNIVVSFTPVYVFSHDPNATTGGDGSSVIAQLDRVQSVKNNVAATCITMPRRSVKDDTTLGSAKAAPMLGEQRPMRHYGLTDMTADNITDLTGADAAFDVVPGNPLTRQLSDEEVTGVENVAVDDDGDVEYYNLQGVRVTNPGHGVYIERRGNRATKVIK